MLHNPKCNNCEMFKNKTETFCDLCLYGPIEKETLMKQKQFFECCYFVGNKKLNWDKQYIMVQADDFKSAMDKFYEIAQSGDIGEQVKLQSISESNMKIYVE